MAPDEWIIEAGGARDCGGVKRLGAAMIEQNGRCPMGAGALGSAGPRIGPGSSVPISGSVVLACSSEGNGGGASPRGAGAAAPVSLPCQSSNSSTETRNELSAYQRKNAYILKENLEALIEKFGIEQIGFLTLTFPNSLTLKQANTRFNSLATHVFGDLFPAWVCVREF